MAYRIAPDDPTLQDALRRIAGEELGAALAAMGQHGLSPATVHDIRKRIKKLRGLLRLVQSSFPGFAAENAALRETGGLLAARRDAEVRLATFDSLFPDCPHALEPLHRHLLHGREAARTAPDRLQAEQALTAIHARARDWTLNGDDGKILLRGLARTRRRAIRAMEDAALSPGYVALHDWRKRAKDFGCQARLLTPIWPEVITPLSDAADALTEELGIHHDIAVLVSGLPPGLLSAKAEASLIRRANSAQKKVEAQVFPKGRLLFAGEPKAVAKLWHCWWVLWRDQAASAPDSPLSISATVSSTP